MKILNNTDAPPTKKQPALAGRLLFAGGLNSLRFLFHVRAF